MRTLAATLASSVFATAVLFGASHLAWSNGKPPTSPAPTAQPATVRAAAPFSTARLWTDPPERPETRTIAAAPAPVPAPVVQVAAQEPARPVALRFENPKRAEQARRRRMAQATIRARQVAARTIPPSGQSAAGTGNAPAGQPVAAQRVDPITDLLRGLGIGGEG